MPAGKYDQRVTFETENVTGQNASGEDVIGTPTELATISAAVRYMQGRELQVAQQTAAEAKYKIEFRRNPDLKLLKRKDTARWNDQILDILDVNGPGTREPEWSVTAKDHVS